MIRRPSTQIGDVLILMTDQTYCTYAVGLVSTMGQQDFHEHRPTKYATDRAAAIAAAKALVVPGRQVFLRNIDSNEWSEISE